MASALGLVLLVGTLVSLALLLALRRIGSDRRIVR
jgi:hypothetical protein